MPIPGLIALIGSGETSAAGRTVFETLCQDLPDGFEASVLETPAGFELNSAMVAGRIADFIRLQLEHRRVKVGLVPARAKGATFSPDSTTVVEPLYSSRLSFLGPGSPSYAVRQLSGSLAWEVLRASHRAGAALAFASAAAVACGRLALPVYEIFKVGEDPHWKPGLDLLAPFGLKLSVIPHWNNNEGGQNVDTNRCFIGRQRFEALLTQVPAGESILGLDEHTALVLDLNAGECRVSGQGQVHILRGGSESHFTSGATFSIHKLGDYAPLIDPWLDIPPEIAQRFQDKPASLLPVPQEVQDLVNARQAARQNRDWPQADRLRQAALVLGWSIKDTPSGPQIEKLS